MANRKRLSTVSGFMGRFGSVEMVKPEDVQEIGSYGGRGECGQHGQLRLQEDTLSLLHIQTTEQGCLALRRAARRIRSNIRKSDTVLLSNKACAILLPETPLLGAQAVARRVYTLLVGIEYDVQILYGAAAYALMRQVRSHYAEVIHKDMLLLEETGSTKRYEIERIREEEPLPYLAFLASYPSQRLLHMFPYELADRYHCIPIGSERGVLTLATCRQLQQETVVYLREVIQRNIFQVRCEAGIIDDVLRHWQRAIAV
ncbi:MAG: hypothetical protein NVSMB49_22160 [Ktedonobacteraceae bacterium]